MMTGSCWLHTSMEKSVTPRLLVIQMYSTPSGVYPPYCPVPGAPVAHVSQVSGVGPAGGWLGWWTPDEKINRPWNTPAAAMMMILSAFLYYGDRLSIIKSIDWLSYKVWMNQNQMLKSHLWTVMTTHFGTNKTAHIITSPNTRLFYLSANVWPQF